MEAVVVMESAMEPATESATPEASAVKSASVSRTGESRCGEREEKHCDERETDDPAKHAAPPRSEVLEVYRRLGRAGCPRVLDALSRAAVRSL
jgi:hypothetical protein